MCFWHTQPDDDILRSISNLLCYIQTYIELSVYIKINIIYIYLFTYIYNVIKYNYVNIVHIYECMYICACVIVSLHLCLYIRTCWRPMSKEHRH